MRSLRGVLAVLLLAAPAALAQDDLGSDNAPAKAQAAPAAPKSDKFSDLLFPVFQQSKCTNCHGMASRNKNYERHVAAHRFAEGADTNDITSCMKCHTKAKGYVDTWQAPPKEMDFSGKDPKTTCKMIQVGFAKGPLMDHLHDDPRVQWGVKKLKVDDWNAALEAWFKGGMKCE